MSVYPLVSFWLQSSSNECLHLMQQDKQGDADVRLNGHGEGKHGNEAV